MTLRRVFARANVISKVYRYLRFYLFMKHRHLKTEKSYDVQRRLLFLSRAYIRERAPTDSEEKRKKKGASLDGVSITVYAVNAVAAVWFDSVKTNSTRYL